MAIVTYYVRYKTIWIDSFEEPKLFLMKKSCNSIGSVNK